jgi:hypothetical protein
MDHPDRKICDFVREHLVEETSPHCGPVKIKVCSTSSSSCCAGYEDTIDHQIPGPMLEHMRGVMEAVVLDSDMNIPRRLNRELGPVIQNIHIASPTGPALSIFSTCIPCVVNGYRYEIVFALLSFRPSSIAHSDEYWLDAKRKMLFTLE